MGWQSIIGWMIAAMCFVVAVSMLAPLASLFDLTSMVMVLFAAPAILLMTYGRRTKMFFVGLHSTMMPRHAQPLDPPQHQQVARMARSLGQYALLSGAAGTFIGCVQMLQNLEDVRSIGPALAVGLLTLLYGVLLKLFVAMPVQYHHLRMAGADPADFIDHADALRLIGLMGVSVGVTFFIMLIAMASWA
jgi:hypothetical protein